MTDQLLNLFAAVHIVLVWAIVIIGTLGLGLFTLDRVVSFFLRRTEAWLTFFDFLQHRKAFKRWFKETSEKP